MARNSKSKAQKKPATKKVARKLPSVQKAPIRKRVTLRKENHPPAATLPVSATSTSTQTSARRMRTGVQPVVPTLDKGMRIYHCCPQLIAPTDSAAPAAAVSQGSQDLSPADAAELASLRGEYSTSLVCGSN